AFAAVVNPEYIWSERAQKGLAGFTEFGVGVNKASITYPVGDSPVTRAVKLRELLHVRFTPEIMAARRSPDVSGDAKQIAQDIRLAEKSRALDLAKDDTYYPISIIKDYAKAAAGSERRLATLYMSTYNQPIEGGWDSRNLKAFTQQTETRDALSSRNIIHLLN